MGKELAITYEEVLAKRASIGGYAQDSGRYPTNGVLVTWTLNGGFTGQGWDEEDWRSPKNFVSDAEWEEDIADGNLNTTFARWTGEDGQELGLRFEDRYDWVGKMIDQGCAVEMQ